MKKAMMMMWAAPCGKCVEVAYVISTCYLSSDDHRTQFIHSWFPHFILLYYYYYVPCVRVSRVRQAMSRARILSTFHSWVGRSVRGSSPGIGNWHRIANGVDGNWRRI